MKAALQEEGEEEGEVQRDAKGKEILSPEEKARRDEKARKQAAEVSFLRTLLTQYINASSMCSIESSSACREGVEARREPRPQNLDIHRVCRRSE